MATKSGSDQSFLEPDRGSDPSSGKEKSGSRPAADAVDYDASERRLTYRLQGEQGDRVLPGRNIIALTQLPGLGSGPPRHAILYVEPQVNGEDGKSSDTADNSQPRDGGSDGSQLAQSNEQTDNSAGEMKRIVAKLPLVKSVILYGVPQQLIVDYGTELSTIVGPNIVVSVIVSTKSGTGQADAFYQKALRPALEFIGAKENENYTLHYTTSAESVSKLARGSLLDRAAKGEAQRIILLSGDGGIHDTVNAIALEGKERLRGPNYVPPQISLLPLGTGNALANSIGMMESDDTWGLSHLFRGSPRKLPVMSVGFSGDAVLVGPEGQEQVPRVENTPLIYSVVVCSWGIHSAIVADSDTEELRKLGAERFSAAAVQNLFPQDGSEAHIYKAKISLQREGSEGQPVEPWEAIDRSEHSYVLATTVSQLERGFNISPASKPLDEVIRVVHWGPKSGKESMRILMLAAQNGKHVEDDAVNYDAVHGLKIELGGQEPSWRYRRICVDGKTVLLGEDGFVECKKSDVHIIDVVCIVP